MPLNSNCPSPLSGSIRGDFFATGPWFDLLAATATNPGDEIIHVQPARGGLNMPFRIHGGSPRRITGFSNFYSGLYEPVYDQDYTSHDIQEILNELTASRSWDVLEFAPLDTEGLFHVHLLEALGQAGLLFDRFHCFGNWYLSVADGGYVRYMADRPSALRNTVKRAQSKLAKRPNTGIRVITTEGSELEAAIRDFDRLYLLRGRKPEPYPDFVPGLCRLAARHGWLRMGILDLEGEAVAAQIWITKDDKSLIYKLAYNPSVGNLSVGSVLTAHMMALAIDGDRVREADFLIGDDSYKRDWMSSRRERQGIIVFNRRSFGGLREAAHHFGGRLVRRYRPAGNKTPTHD